MQVTVKSQIYKFNYLLEISSKETNNQSHQKLIKNDQSHQRRLQLELEPIRDFS